MKSRRGVAWVISLEVLFSMELRLSSDGSYKGVYCDCTMSSGGITSLIPVANNMFGGRVVVRF